MTGRIESLDNPKVKDAVRLRGVRVEGREGEDSRGHQARRGVRAGWLICAISNALAPVAPVSKGVSISPGRPTAGTQ